MAETVMKQHDRCDRKPPVPLAPRADAHAITKLKPKIRIVHIVAPEIIQTDAANFRDLVQRLTGKHARRGSGGRKRPAGPAQRGEKAEAAGLHDLKALVGKLHGYRDAPAGLGDRVKVEVEVEAEELVVSDNPSALFGGLGDLDGFMQGLSELPLLPLGFSHLDLLGEETSTSGSE